MGFAGTLIFTGQASALVVETGDRAEIGKIAGLLGGVKQQTTPLVLQIEHFGRTVSRSVWGVGRGGSFISCRASPQYTAIFITFSVLLCA